MEFTIYGRNSGERYQAIETVTTACDARLCVLRGDYDFYRVWITHEHETPIVVMGNEWLDGLWEYYQ